MGFSFPINQTNVNHFPLPQPRWTGPGRFGYRPDKPASGRHPMISYGGDYNPEQWPEPVWEHDVELMRLAGVTLVTVGVFAWSSLEPAPGRYTFEWLDRALDLLHAGGIRVALATPTASPPPWFSLAHPQALP